MSDEATIVLKAAIALAVEEGVDEEVAADLAHNTAYSRAIEAVYPKIIGLFDEKRRPEVPNRVAAVVLRYAMGNRDNCDPRQRKGKR